MCADADVVPSDSTGDHSVPSAPSSSPVITSALRRDALHSIFGDSYSSLLEEDDEEVGKSAPASPCADKVITLLILSILFQD